MDAGRTSAAMDLWDRLMAPDLLPLDAAELARRQARDLAEIWMEELEKELNEQEES